MSNPKIPQGYHGTYAQAADGSATLIMVSRSDSIANRNKQNKEQKKPMSNNPASEQMTITDGGQPNGQFTPYTTEQKKEFAKQFTPEQRRSYRQGQKNAYAHMGNIGRRNSLYIHGNLQRDEAATPPPAPPADKPKGNRRNTGNKNN